MKKTQLLVYGVILVLFTTIGSCKKTNLKADEQITLEATDLLATISTSSYTTPSGSKMLVFESVSEWDAKLDSLGDLEDSIVIDWSDNIAGFISQRAFYENPQDNDLNPNEDEDLANVLNNDGAVIIADKAYMPDFTNAYVYVCNLLSQTNIDDMVNKNLTNLNVIRYPIHYEVLHMNEEGWDNELEVESPTPLYQGNAIKSRARCRDKHASGKNDKKVGQFCSNLQRIKAKVAYQNAGIHFSLKMKAKNQFKDGINWDKISYQTFWKYDVRFFPKCGSEVTIQSSAWSQYLSPQTLKSHKYKFYSSSKALTKYYLDASYKVLDNCSNPATNIFPGLDLLKVGY